MIEKSKSAESRFILTFTPRWREHRKLMWRVLSDTRSRAGAGFTLLELVVSIGIVLILASILLVAMRSAISRMRRIACMGNQRQLSLACFLYSDDQQDALPANGTSDPDEHTPQQRLWVYGSNHLAWFPFTNSAALTDSRYALFADYIKAVSIYRCPSDSGDSGKVFRRPNRIRSYSMNLFLGLDPNRGIEFYRDENTNYMLFLKRSDIKAIAPSDLFLFQDVNPISLCHSAFVVKMNPTSNFYHFPGIHHKGRSMIAYADGHVESHRWNEARTRGPIISHWQEISVPNPDLEWLKRHTSRIRPETVDFMSIRPR